MRLTNQMTRRKKRILTRKSTVKTSMILTLMTSIPLAVVQVSLLFPIIDGAAVLVTYFEV